MESLGRHLIIELYDCNPKNISDVKRVEEVMLAATNAIRAKIVDTIFHTFTPYGVSGIIVIAESHLAIHTWPEYKFASIDVYTCGKKINPWRAYKILEKGFEAKSANAMEMKRGVIKMPRGKLKHKPTA